MDHTVLLGNGLNRCKNATKSWNELLGDLSKDYKVEVNEELQKNLYTFFYERIILSSGQKDSPDGKEEKIKMDIAKEMKKVEPSDLYDFLIHLKVSHYITTNYDYCIEKMLEKKTYRKRSAENSEKTYSIRRGVGYEKSEGKLKFVWHVHGEVDYPKSIMLGLDHYCGAISKMDAYMKGRYSFIKNGKEIKIASIISKLKGKSEYDHLSWLELFFTSNIHILGFGLDYSETDFWWILNWRARIQKSLKLTLLNQIYYYGEIDKTKADLLAAFDVKYVEIKLEDGDYYQQNLEILSCIKDRINYI